MIEKKELIIYNYDRFGRPTGTNLADESPLEPGVFLIPAYATTVKPPDFKEGFDIIYNPNKNNFDQVELKDGFRVLYNHNTKTFDYIEMDIDESEETIKPLNVEEIRINSIKAKAGEIINSRYTIIKQMNIYGEGGDKQVEMVAWIKKIREISNKAELDGTALADINWEI